MKETLKNKPLVIQLTTAIAFIGFVVYWSFMVGATLEGIEFRVEDTNRRVDHLSEKYVTIRDDVTVLQEKNSDVLMRIKVLEEILMRMEKTQNEILSRVK